MSTILCQTYLDFYTMFLDIDYKSDIKQETRRPTPKIRNHSQYKLPVRRPPYILPLLKYVNGWHLIFKNVNGFDIITIMLMGQFQCSKIDISSGNSLNLQHNCPLSDIIKLWDLQKVRSDARVHYHNLRGCSSCALGRRAITGSKCRTDASYVTGAYSIVTMGPFFYRSWRRSRW